MHGAGNSLIRGRGNLLCEGCGGSTKVLAFQEGTNGLDAYQAQRVLVPTKFFLEEICMATRKNLARAQAHREILLWAVSFLRVCLTEISGSIASHKLLLCNVTLLANTSW